MRPSTVTSATVSSTVASATVSAVTACKPPPPTVPLPSRLRRSRVNVSRCWFCKKIFFPQQSDHIAFENAYLYADDTEGDGERAGDDDAGAVLCHLCLAKVKEPDSDIESEGDFWSGDESET